MKITTVDSKNIIQIDRTHPLKLSGLLYINKHSNYHNLRKSLSTIEKEVETWKVNKPTKKPIKSLNLLCDK